MYCLGCSYNCTKIKMFKTVYMYCELEISNIVYPVIQTKN